LEWYDYQSRSNRDPDFNPTQDKEENNSELPSANERQETTGQSIKKERKQSLLNQKETDKQSSLTLVAPFVFHIDPETTHSIQVFALYRADNLDSMDHGKEEETHSSTTLYYSSVISLVDLLR